METKFTMIWVVSSIHLPIVTVLIAVFIESFKFFCLMGAKA